MRDVRYEWWLLVVAVLVLIGCGQQVAEEPLSVEQTEPVGEQADDEDELHATGPPPSEGDSQPAGDERAGTDDVEVQKADEGETESQADTESGPADPQPETKVVELPYREPGDDGVMPSALLRGTLAADRDVDGGCAWVAHEDGGVTPVRWDQRYRMRFPSDGGPAEMLDETGTVVAREGDEIELGGGSVSAWGPLERCHMGDRDRAFWGWLM